MYIVKHMYVVLSASDSSPTLDLILSMTLSASWAYLIPICSVSSPKRYDNVITVADSTMASADL